MPSTRRAKAFLLAAILLVTGSLYLCFHPSSSAARSSIYLHQLRSVTAAERNSELAQLISAHTILIFSKTHCPYSATAKQILTGKYHTVPPPFIVELDQHPKGSELQDALADLTGRKTVPNVLVAGRSIGGGDDIAKLDREGQLADTIRRLAGTRLKQIFVLKS